MDGPNGNGPIVRVAQWGHHPGSLMNRVALESVDHMPQRVARLAIDVTRTAGV